jgi:hypothetical protein
MRSRKSAPPAPRKSNNKPCSGRPKLHFSSKEKKKKFSQAVHQASLEHCDSEVSPEEEHYINMADAEIFEELEGDVDDSADNDSEDEDGGVSALVAAALGNLLKD